MHVLLDDDQGRLTLRRLRPWHKMLVQVPARGCGALLSAKVSALELFVVQQFGGRALRTRRPFIGYAAISRDIP
jgi:hypothetical protein